MIGYRPITAENRAEVTAFLLKRWGGTEMILRGERVDITSVDGVCAYDGDALVGLLTYRPLGDDAVDLTSLDSLREGLGIGSALIEKAADIAREMGRRRLVLITTNDNLRALGMYQHRGFDIVRLYRNTMDEVRRLKPAVPLIGENGIPLRHEIELERILVSGQPAEA